MGIRRLVAVLAMLLVSASVLVPTAGAKVQPWDGVWHTRNKFGTPTLHLDQKNGEVTGWYGNSSGRIGRIGGDLSERGQRWIGRYKADDGSDAGRFNVMLVELSTFDGWFKSCTSWVLPCSKRHDWNGEHA